MHEELPFIVGAGTLAAFEFGGDAWLGGLSNPLVALALLVWLFAAALWVAFGVVQYAEALATKLGEPFDTLTLTIAVVGIEVSLISPAQARRPWRAIPCSRS